MNWLPRNPDSWPEHWRFEFQEREAMMLEHIDPQTATAEQLADAKHRAEADTRHRAASER